MPIVPHTAGRSGAASTVVIAAHAMVAARISEIPSLRSGGWPASAPPLPPRFLRHADEQTVVGMHAVLAAIASLPERPALDTHAVIAASCQAGRFGGAQALVQASTGGGVAVSTHVIPQCSLHSPAGAVSVGLGMHGPNIGVSGGPDALSEGMLAAFSWLQQPADAGSDTAWLIITGWDDEPSLDAAGTPTNDPICRAVAVALARPSSAGLADCGTSLPEQDTTTADPGNPRRFHRSATWKMVMDDFGQLAADERLTLTLDPHDGMAVSPSADSLRRFGESLAEHARAGMAATWSHRFPWGGRVQLAVAATARRREAA
ncbi:MAG: hypothetical protein ACKOEX_06610 [Planctomycetia bacterium]